MIETLLEQVNAAVDRFVAKNSSLRNDRDDLVQDVFLKILPQIDGGSFSLPQCRAFAHRATFWVCHTALREKCTAKRKKTLRLGDRDVHHIEFDTNRVTSRPFCSATEALSGLFYDRVVIDWNRVQAVVDENDALFTWFAIEPDTGVSENLRKQIMDKFEFILP